MPIPKSVTKIKTYNGFSGVEYTSNVDKANYFIFELARAALRDVGKYILKMFKLNFYEHFGLWTGKAGKVTRYKVFSNKDTTKPRVEIGLKTGQVPGFYGYFQEFGTSKQPKLGLLAKTVEENIAKIIEIESKYLSALEDEAEALALISEDEYEGGADDE